VQALIASGLACVLIAAPVAALANALPLQAQATAGDAQTLQPDTVPASPADTVKGTRLRPVVITADSLRAHGYFARRSVSAMKTDTPLRSTPQAITVVTGQLIADQAMQNMADVVRYVPGITMGQGEGHRDAPTVRGNSSTSDFFVDGFRDDAQYYRDLYNIERVEALKGSNAMIFGRGGGGGVINRVTKEAQFAPVASMSLEGGTYDHVRGTADVGAALTPVLAGRVNAMYDNSGSHRDQVSLERYGFNPTLTIGTGEATSVRLGYELFDDRRTVDRGIPSLGGAPLGTDAATFFGDPSVNGAAARVHAGNIVVDHAFTPTLRLRNATRVMDYDKFYQNVVPGAVTVPNTSGAEATVSFTAYNNATERLNLFNQTDLTTMLATGSVRHTLLVGAELGRQTTQNVRMTGYFGGTATSYSSPLSRPTISVPVDFRPNATDPNNDVTADVASLYVQDQLALTARWQAILGLRADRFALSYDDRRGGPSFERTDNMLSPRAGLVFDAARALSLYASYGVSHLPSSGDQFSSLNASTQALEPERFDNYEIGAKLDAGRYLSLTTAAYRLDRSNSTARDPRDNTKLVQTGSVRTTGYELGVTGSLTDWWQVAGGWSAQRAAVSATTTSAPKGTTVPLVPHTTISLWNSWRPFPLLGAGLGVVHQGEMYTSLDNAVTLPAFTRVDAALFATLTPHVRLQLNVENLFDREYYPTAHNNNNILPGAPRTLRITAGVRR
jgi:catecholate siderophore receptor